MTTCYLFIYDTYQYYISTCKCNIYELLCVNVGREERERERARKESCAWNDLRSVFNDPQTSKACNSKVREAASNWDGSRTCDRTTAHSGKLMQIPGPSALFRTFHAKPPFLLVDFGPVRTLTVLTSPALGT